jgi:phosphate starvation-inducible PhoH-like protein
VVTGDITQVDLPSGRRSGLIHALGVLSNIDDIAMVHFSDVDVVRHRLVAQIIRAYRVAEDRT